MSNPYRARPTRSRVDHNLGYGAHNQNMWNPTGRMQSDVPSNDSVQQQSAVMNQSKQTADPWNNSWNWDFDKQTDNLQQQPPPQEQQQPQHYAPPYKNQGQLISNSIQDHYYQNVNGNKTDSINQNSIPDGNTHGTAGNRQPISNHSDSFPPYLNYPYQQYPPPPRPNSGKSVSLDYDRPQWTNEPQPHQPAPYPQQRSAVQSQEDQAAYSFLAGNNYNWHKSDQMNSLPPNNCQSKVPGDWPDPEMDTEAKHFDDMGNQCLPWPPRNRSNQHLPPAPENITKEHSTNDANNVSNQMNMSASKWSNQNYESVLPNQAQQTQGSTVNNDFNPWPQPISADPLQQWKHSNESHSSQWLQEQQENNNLPEEHLQPDNANVILSNDWQQSRTPAHYSLPNMPPPPPLETGVEPEERKKSVPSLIPNILSKDPAMKASVSKTQLSDSRLNMSSTPETVSTVASSENVSVQENNEFNSVGDLAEWGKNSSPEELPAKLEQMSLGPKTSKHLEHQSESSEALPVPAVSGDVWAQSTAPHATTDHIPGVSSEYAAVAAEHSQPIDNQVNKELSAQSGYQAPSVPSVDNLVQSGYDQWYNQNTLPRSSEYPWYTKDLTRPTKDWSAEQNVENYENIQQPTEFVNLEVVTPSLQERDIYGSRDSINKETLDNDPKPVINPVKETASTRDFRQEVNNVEVPAAQQPTRSLPPLQPEQVPDNYEFASNDRNTFLETGELTDSHQEHEPTPPSQDDENDEVPNDIPFLREVPGQSSSIDPRRNDPTGQEQYVQSAQRLSDPRRNDPSGQEQGLQMRNISDRSERRDIPPGQERSVPMLSRADSDTLERRNDPSGRERSLPPQQSRNDPSGEERHQPQPQIMLESSETREVPGRGNEPEDPNQQTDENLRQIPGGASPNEVAQSSDDRPNGRVVTGSQEVPSTSSGISEQASDSRIKREEAVGASIREAQGASSSSNRRDSYDDENDEGSGNSRDDSRERRRDSSSERRRYEYERKNSYYDREREYEDEYYYDRRRGAETDRPYNGRDEFDRREMPYIQDDRKHHSRDDLDRHPREDIERRNKPKDDLDERDSRRRPPDDRRRDRVDDVRRREREIRDYDPRYPWDRNYVDRDRRRDDRRPRRYDDYDIRDPYYDDPYSRGSRPSSRSSYNDRDRAYYVRSRDPYYGYNGGYPGYDYGAHYASNYYAYIENLRRTNPAAYSEWYHKYYANRHQQQLVSRGVTNYPEDRASVHSGRSSCDDRTTGDKRTLADMSLLEDSTSASARMTPTKFSTSHAYGCFSIGSLIHVLPSYPTDGERAKVDILKLDNLLLHDPVTRDLRAYPGPLIKGVTHKKTIIEYCENKIKKAAANEEMADRASYILLYELMIMLIQQNGNVVGVDIAALLLRNKEAYPYELAKKPQDSGRRESVISQRSELGGDGFQSSQDGGAAVSEKPESKPRKSLEQITDEFRNTLLYGLVQEALEYAMNEGLWGHALFLASKLDKRTHASVMTRFANSLPYHDPLQTLYQLHSGRVPAVVTGISDPQWDDWRPHLAMIISNTSSNPDINRRSITILGDTLSARGDIHAAHFCYILSQVDFGAYGASNVKLVLIGANHHKPYNTFLSTEAVMLTEIYEYARNLSEPRFTLVDLQTFKFDLASKMMDHGLIEKALLYIEQIAVNIANEPSKYKKSFICSVYNLGDRIKYHDPVYKDSTDEVITVPWFDNLAEIVSKCYSGEIVENDASGSHAKQESYGSAQAPEMYETKHPLQQLQQQQQAQQWNPPQAEYREGPSSMMDVPSTDVQSEWQPLSLPANIPDTYDQSMQYARNNDESYQQSQQQDYWNQESYYQSNYGSSVANWQQQSAGAPYPPEQGDTDDSQLQEKWNYETETEEKTATPEVSNYALTADSSIVPGERSLDGANVSSLRRRKVLSDTLAKPVGGIVSGSSAESNVVISSSSVSNPYRSSHVDEVKSTKPSKKLITYPKITTTYPKFLPSNKSPPRDARKVKKIDGRYVKPPPSEPPVFLKCKVRKKSDHDNDTIPCEPETQANEDSFNSPAATTDLDVQFTEVSLETISKLDSRLGRGTPAGPSPDTDSQTLKQYCNFEDKKVMRVAPHIRRKDVICDTVDAWSYANSSQNSSEFSRYKPLVFGGTYPIDLPIRPVRSDLNLAKLADLPVGKLIMKTYDIDVPTNCE
ncbi:endoplasmic reticulum export factor secretory 16 isoform X2 [Halictus rubicundus]|uniref:endoplasmic reticulum export factor secretory 16 isoform X2 n=1 Tax=Halictus rubicundus TaxID=77578 RepID=UPI00403667DA